MKRLITLGLFLLAACGTAPETTQPTTTQSAPAQPTAEQAITCEPTDFLKQIEPLAREWSDTVTLADSTPRMQLAAQISKLQDIQRRTEALEAPNCAASAQTYLAQEMGLTNKSFVAFLAQNPQATIDELFVLAKEQQDGYKDAIKHLKAAEPAPAALEIFTDGLNVSGDVLQAPFIKMGLSFNGWHSGSTLGTSEDAWSSVRLGGTPENVASASVNGAMKGWSEDRKKEIQGYMQTMLSLAMPDWKESEAWLNAAMKLEHGSTAIANRGRYVRYERLNAGTTSWEIRIDVPQ